MLQPFDINFFERECILIGVWWMDSQSEILDKLFLAFLAILYHKISRKTIMMMAKHGIHEEEKKTDTLSLFLSSPLLRIKNARCCASIHSQTHKPLNY